MPDRLPIQDAKEIAQKRGLRQVILLAWDGERSHVVTYGKSVEDCDQAAQGGERMKKFMLIRLRPTHTSRSTYAIYLVVSHNVQCHIEGIGR